MTREKGKKNPKSLALLTGYDAAGSSVYEEEMSLDEYYDGTHEVIDSSQFRRNRKIVRVIGRLYNFKGRLIQEFENEYGPDGVLSHQKTRYEDGTVIEN